MTQIIMHVNATRAKQMLDGYTKTLPRAGIEGVKRLASFAAKAYLNAAFNAKIRAWRGQFYGTLVKQITKPHKISKSSYGVNIGSIKRGAINYFISLDRMRPHFVNLKKGRIITKWASARGFDLRSTKKLFVRPHPFIKTADTIIKQQAKRIVERKISQAVRAKGKGGGSVFFK